MVETPYMIVVGDKEIEANTVGVRHRKEGDLGAMSLDAFIEKALKVKGLTEPTEDNEPSPPFAGSRISSIDLEGVNSERIDFSVSPDYYAGRDLVIICKSEAELSLGRVFKYSPYDIDDIGQAVLRAMDDHSCQPKLRDEITKHYNVSTCVDKLVKSYQRINR